MKHSAMISILIAALAACICSARTDQASQGLTLKSVAECRAYREAWNTSTSRDLIALSEPELWTRAQQMVSCATEIDTQPFKAEMTKDQAMEVAVANSSYAILAAAYYREIANRSSVFISLKGLRTEFLAYDRSIWAPAKEKEK